jgi:FlgD Ig-like domain/Beta-propeller repeat
MKKAILGFSLMLITICTFAQEPDWEWATQAGGNDLDRSRGIAIDDAGNSFVTGIFRGTAIFGQYTLIAHYGNNDIFVAKMDANGNWLWATKAGGNYLDYSYAIALDDNGNCYVTGCFSGIASFGSYSLTTNGNNDSDIFVAKMDANGNWLWATKAGGSNSDEGYSIALDDSGNCYVTGEFEGIATFGSYSVTGYAYDIFVAKMDANGNWLWATEAGGEDESNGIAIDDNGNCYVTGNFIGTATFGSYSVTSYGNNDIFVAKMDANGNWLWATKAGGSSSDKGFGIAIDDTGNSFVTGMFCGPATFGSYSVTSYGNNDIFVAKMDTNGNWLWATKAGGNSWDCGRGIAIDDTGNSFVTGMFCGPAIFGSYSLTTNGNNYYSDIFIAKMDTNGNWLWATNAGGSSYDEGNGIAIDDNGNFYVTGSYMDTANFGNFSLTSSGDYDIFAAKLGNDVSAENNIYLFNKNPSNHPNPFNPTTTIEFSIHNDSDIKLTILNIKGQKIKTVAQNNYTKGNHSIIWNGDDDYGKSVCSGVYYYKLNVNGKTEAIKKCLLLK